MTSLKVSIINFISWTERWLLKVFYAISVTIALSRTSWKFVVKLVPVYNFILLIFACVVLRKVHVHSLFTSKTVGFPECLCHKGGKSTWPDRDSNPRPLADRASTLTTERRPVTILPCLIRFVPESARNHAGTIETVSMLLSARARTHTESPNVTGEEKAHGPTGTRTQDLSHRPCEYSDHWATEPHCRPVSIAIFILR